MVQEVTQGTGTGASAGAVIYKDGIKNLSDIFFKTMGMWLFILNQMTNLT